MLNLTLESLPGRSFPSHRLANKNVSVTGIPQLDEQKRRLEVGRAGRVYLSGPEVSVLAGLPLERELSVADLDPVVVKRCHSIPSWAVEVGFGYVKRLADLPMRETRLCVQASSLGSGIQRAAKFSSFFPRQVILSNWSGMGFNPDLDLLEASWYGIGVAILDDDELETLLEPTLGRRPLHAEWTLAEMWLACVIGSSDCLAAAHQ